ncbi:AAA family ATPase [Eubacteriales bacterium KG127]
MKHLKIIEEIDKVIVGKTEVIKDILKAVLADGHVLLNDVPGVGKTTLALAFSKTMGLESKRIQFTPDVVPSDIVGFSMYNQKENKFEYQPGSAMTNFLIADEINRASSKTQSALLEVMQEGKMTVDGVSYFVPKPFVVMATQNPVGAAGTQMLPEAQLDRFMIQLSVGYPDFEEQVRLLSDRQVEDPLNKISQVCTREEILEMKESAKKIFCDEKILKYITSLTEATRNSDYISLGLSPRAALSILAMSKANAYIDNRDYVVPGDVETIFLPVARHRIVLSSKSIMANVKNDDLLTQILESVNPPRLV